MTLLYLAAFLTFAIGVAHSYLGERYILIRLFRRENLPKLFGGTTFTTRTLRFAWHITTLAWWGFAVLLLFLAQRALTSKRVLLVIGGVFLASGALTLVASRGRHLAWPVFLFIGLAALYAALG